MSKLFKDAEERYQALVIMAGVAMHALIASKVGTVSTTPTAFDIAEQFLAEAERRTDSSP
jgi:hypothetical protein